MKNLILTVIAVCSLNTIQAQEISYKKWVKEAPRLEDSFFHYSQSKRSGRNCSFIPATYRRMAQKH